MVVEFGINSIKSLYSFAIRNDDNCLISVCRVERKTAAISDFWYWIFYR